MRLGMIGLGKMGYNLVLNLLEQQHDVVVYDVNPEPGKDLQTKGAYPVGSLGEMASMLTSPRVIWMMVPAGEIVDQTIREILPFLDQGDLLIDGGNSHYKETLRRAATCDEKGVHYFDIGTSGGMEGARNGGCFMIGGDQEAFQHIEDMIRSISVKDGYLYTGKVGSGHFLKMVHNGIEYGMMQAIGEGFEVLDKSQFDYNYEEVSRVWAHGSVIRGWLMDLMQNAFSKDPNLNEIRGVMNASGEGQWTVETALEVQASVPVIALSLLMRYRSQENDTFHGKVVAALRNEFGGHAVVKSE